MGCGWFMDLRFPLALRSAPWIVSSLITGSWGESRVCGVTRIPVATVWCVAARSASHHPPGDPTEPPKDIPAT